MLFAAIPALVERAGSPYGGLEGLPRMDRPILPTIRLTARLTDTQPRLANDRARPAARSGDLVQEVVPGAAALDVGTDLHGMLL